MGKAVGGASAVGCGAFGLGGLLVGVALTVWLGSMAMSGLDTGNESDTGPGTAPVAEQPTLTLDQTTGLGMHDAVDVSGAGFAPGTVTVIQCLSAGTSPDEAAAEGTTGSCAEAGGTEATVAGDGTFEATFDAERVLTVGGTAYDCAAMPGACSLRAGPAGGGAQDGDVVALTFATAPAVDAERPPGT